MCCSGTNVYCTFCTWSRDGHGDDEDDDEDDKEEGDDDRMVMTMRWGNDDVGDHEHADDYEDQDDYEMEMVMMITEVMVMITEVVMGWLRWWW